MPTEPLDARRRILDASIALVAEQGVRAVSFREVARRAGVSHQTPHHHLLDGSVLTQVSASYYASDAWTISAFASANLGDARSERGSLPQRVSGILQLTRYL